MFTLFTRFAFCFSVSITLISCSSSQLGDLFSGYSQQMQMVRAAQQAGDFTQAQSLVHKRSSSDGSYGLSLLEIGRLQFLAHDWPASKDNFSIVYQQVQSSEAQAKIQISRGIENVAAVVSNDNAIRYDIPLYEQGMLHSYQALNYLYQQDLSAALVEIRRANLVQERALAKNKNSLYKAQNKMSKSGVPLSSLSNSYPSMANTIGDIKNGFQNAYTFYLSGLLYEAAGEENDAYIDYKKALEIYPNNTFLQQDVLRLATKLSMTDDLSLFQGKWGQYKGNLNSNNGQVVVIIEREIVNAKQEISLNLPIFTSHNDMRFYSFSLPVYRDNILPINNAFLTYENKTYQAQEIVRLQSLAAKQLKDQLPSIVTRQIIRLIAKEEMRQQMSEKNGDIGNILASLYNVATEHADTRSWSTLPASVQLLKLDLPVGRHNLKLNISGQEQLINIEVNANRMTLINLSAIGQHINYQTINL